MEMPQRELSMRLCLAIDRAQRHPRWGQAVAVLLEENPRGAASSHVTHNLGAARRAWLARVHATHKGLVGPSLEKEDTMVRKAEIPATKKTKQTPPKGQEKGQTVRGDAVPNKKGSTR